MDTSPVTLTAGQPAQTDSTKLPSFYSPRTQPTAAADDVPSSELNALDGARQPETSAPRPVLPHVPATGAAANTRPSGSILREALGHDQPLPPPSLISPAFTPPGTPGTSTPNPNPSSLIPRGVPVDSSVETGGCGNKRPRLLEKLPEVQCIVRARIPTTAGTEMFLHLYSNNVDNKEHLAIVFGNNIRSRSLDAVRPGETEMDRMIRGAYTGVLYPGRTSSAATSASDGSQPQQQPQDGDRKDTPLVRIHSECYTGETAWSARCDCGEQLDEAARLMALPSNAGAGGIIVYLRQEGRGIGLGEKLKAYNLQDLGSDTVEANLLLRHPADARSYGLATAILQDLGQAEIRLLTNNPDKIRAVEGPNREVVVRERVAMIPLSWRGRGGFRSKEVEGYLKTKIEKMGHMLDGGSMPS